MSSKQEHPIQAMGFWMFGFLSVVLAVLKLTVAGYWSWWRVMLPFLAFLGHNAVYLLAGFLCFCWLKQSLRDAKCPEQFSVRLSPCSPSSCCVNGEDCEARTVDRPRYALLLFSLPIADDRRRK